MSEAVEILIKADDQASQKVADAAVNTDKALKRVEQITSSLETPTEKYNRQLEELAALHESGAMTAEQFADAEERLKEKIDAAGESAAKSNDNLKSTTNTVAQLASLAGGSEIATIARQIGTVGEKIGELGEVSKTGGAGALAFKASLVGLAAAIGFGIGKVLADVIWQTDEFERSMERAKEQAKELDDELKRMQSSRFANAKEDIELIRDPAEKQAAYQKLMETLDKDIEGVSANVRKSQKDVEEWAAAWKITGDDQQYAADAEEQLKADKEKLAALKAQREEIEKIAGARALENEQIRLANEAKDKSADYLENLRLEIEYLAATRDEQIKLDAARNTTQEDRGEAERLLKERDAIIAKAEAEKELQQAQEKAREDAQKAADKAAEDAAREAQLVNDLIAAEEKRLELQRIEIEQGKEAARAKALMNQGVEEATARRLAAEESALEQLRQEQDDKKNRKSGPQENLQASESRLLTRGSASNPFDETNRLLRDVNATLITVATINTDQLQAQQRTADNTRNTTQFVVPP